MKTWKEFIENEQKQAYFINLMSFVNKEYQTKSCNPDYEDIFKAFKLTPLEKTKVVILGQDPYPNKEFACGLAFSVKKDSKLPKSLVNIFKELETDLGIKKTNGDLTSWAKNGVLLLNTILTVEENNSMSHKNKGWEIFTDHVLMYLASLDKKIVYILWGDKAIRKKELLTNSKQLVLTSPHPSPLSCYRGFFGSKVFSKTCKFLNEPKEFWK